MMAPPWIRFSVLSTLSATLLMLTVAGCQKPEESSPANSTDSPTAAHDDAHEADTKAESTPADDSAAVEALEAAGAILKTNAQGNVTAVDFRSVEAADDALTHLTGTPQVQELYLLQRNQMEL